MGLWLWGLCEVRGTLLVEKLEPGPPSLPALGWGLLPGAQLLLVAHCSGSRHPSAWHMVSEVAGMGALPWGCGKSQSTMAKLTPMQRQCLPGACQTCHLLMLLGPGPPGAWGLQEALL